MGTALEGNYANLPTTLQQLADVGTQYILQIGGDADGPGVQQYAEQAGAGMAHLFVNWLSVPDPARFTSAAASARAALTHLNLNAMSDVAKGEEKIDRIPAQHQLQVLVNHSSDFTDWHGLTMQAFRDYFTTKFPDVVIGQFAIIYDLKAGLEVMAATWTRARTSVAGVAEKALSLMQTLIGGAGLSGADIAGFIDVLGLVASVAGAAPTLGASAGLLGVGAGLAGAIAAPGAEDTGPTDGVTDPDQISDWIIASLKKVSDDVLTAETAVQKLFQNDLDQAQKHPQFFDLAACAKFLRERDADKLVPGADRDDAYQIQVQPSAMRTYAGLMDTAASVLDSGAGQADSLYFSLTNSDWSRNYVGLYPDAASSQFDGVGKIVADSIRDTAQHTRDDAQRLRMCAQLYGETDKQIAATMAKLREATLAIKRREEGTDQSPFVPSHMQFPGRPGEGLY